MKYLIYLFLTFSFLQCKTNTSQEQDTDEVSEYKSPDRVFLEIYDQVLKEYISTEGDIEILAEGYNWSEGPVWIESEQKLLFSDVPENTIYEWSDSSGAKQYLKPSGLTDGSKPSREPGSNGLAIDGKGNLILCQHGDRKVSRMISSVSNPSPQYEGLATSYNGKKFNSPNDLHIGNDGFIVFTDPPYGLLNREIRDIPFCGVYLWEEGQDVKLLIDTISNPNGIALSKNESKLYIANSNHGKAIWYVYDFDKNKKQVSNGKIFYDATALVKTRPGLPDGMKIHSSGLIFGTGPGGVHIFHPDGRHLGLIATNKPTANCAFDTREDYLYMTADDQLLRIKIGKYN
jgi:gluconolactonase